MLRAGFGSSESKKNPSCSDDHLMGDPVSMKSPEKFCVSLTTFARLITPLHSTSKETVARTGAMGGMGGLMVLNPCPFVKLFARSWKSGMVRPARGSEALPSSRLIRKSSGSIGIVQNNPLAAMGGE